MFDIEKSIAFLMAKNHQRAFKLFRNKLTDFGITPPQFATLAFLWKKDNLNQIELGNLMEIDRNTISGIIDRLEESGLVNRVNNPNDRRARNILLTKRGREIKDQLTPIAKKVNEYLVKNLTIEETENLLNLLVKIRSNEIMKNNKERGVFMGLTREELENKIKELEEQLIDTEEEKDFMLTKTLIHVPGGAREKYDKEIATLKENIAELKKQLNNLLP